MNAPHLFCNWTNDELHGWTDSWALVNGTIICVKCGAWQKPKEANLPFSHTNDCVLRHVFTQRPWQKLTDILSELPAVSGRFSAPARLEADAVLAPFNLPLALHVQACKLLHAIGSSRSLVDTRRAANRAEGFVFGVETLRALSLGNIEGLYLAFDHAEQVRLAELGG